MTATAAVVTTTSVNDPRGGGKGWTREDASFAGRGTGWRAERNILGWVTRGERAGGNGGERDRRYWLRRDSLGTCPIHDRRLYLPTAYTHRGRASERTSERLCFVYPALLTRIRAREERRMSAANAYRRAHCSSPSNGPPAAWPFDFRSISRAPLLFR